MQTGLESYIGPAAGVATSVLWTLTTVWFTAASRRVGPTLVNTSRILLALVLHAITHWLIMRSWLPDLLPGQIVFLALSGVIGLAIGDQALFTAFVRIGPRLSTLIMTTAPLFAALFGWVALGERLGGVALFGIALTVGGVIWVVLERPVGAATVYPASLRMSGILLAILAAACQAGGLLLSKQGIGHGWLPEAEHVRPQTATLVRMFFALLGVLPIYVAQRYRERKRREAGIVPPYSGSATVGMMLVACGCVAGPYLGVWMSLVAADRTFVGVAQTLCSFPPIFILPFTVFLYKERISVRAVLGAVIAVAGGALLFFES